MEILYIYAKQYAQIKNLLKNSHKSFRFSFYVWGSISFFSAFYPIVTNDYGDYFDKIYFWVYIYSIIWSIYFFQQMKKQRDEYLIACAKQLNSEIEKINDAKRIILLYIIDNRELLNFLSQTKDIIEVNEKNSMNLLPTFLDNIKTVFRYWFISFVFIVSLFKDECKSIFLNMIHKTDTSQILILFIIIFYLFFVIAASRHILANVINKIYKIPVIGCPEKVYLKEFMHDLSKVIEF